MIKVTVQQMKRYFSKYLSKVENGESIVIFKNKIPIAEIHPIPQVSLQSRPLGLAKEAFKIPESFFKQLPEEIILAFNSGNSS